MEIKQKATTRAGSEAPEEADIRRIPLFQKLSYRMICGLLLALLVVETPFFVFFYHFHQGQLIESLKKSSTDLSQLILTNLEGRMLEAKPHLLDSDLKRLSTQSGAERIMVLNLKGEVKASSADDTKGRTFSLTEPTCAVCHDHSPTALRRTTTVEEGPSRQVFRSVILIDNKPQCLGCHAADQRTNGIFIVDLPMAHAREQLQSNLRKMLSLALIMVVVTIAALGLLMNRFILRRIKALWTATVAIREGNLNEQVHVAGRDELSELAASFNMMMASLKESLREINRQKDFLQSLIDSIEDEIVVVDRNLRIVTANNAYLRSCGYRREEIVGQHCLSVLHERLMCCHQFLEEGCPTRALFESGAVEKTLRRFRDGDGNEKFVEIYCYPLRDETGQVFQAIEVRRDITERRFLEATLCHSERLASLGLLASGVSHEINNPLASITACTEGLSRRIQSARQTHAPLDVDQFSEYIELIHKEAMRAKAITDRLLILSRKSDSSSYLISINQSLAETVSLVRFQAEEKGIEIIEELDPAVPSLQADDAALRQVFLNLLLNAIQAIDHQGRITVRTHVEPDSVKITFADTGCGIPREDLGRIFEPFFSRKNRHRGTGLGLFISNILIQQMGGRITVQSESGKGAQFVISIPLPEAEGL